MIQIPIPPFTLLEREFGSANKESEAFDALGRKLWSYIRNHDDEVADSPLAALVDQESDGDTTAGAKAKYKNDGRIRHLLRRPIEVACQIDDYSDDIPSREEAKMVLDLVQAKRDSMHDFLRRPCGLATKASDL